MTFLFSFKKLNTWIEKIKCTVDKETIDLISWKDPVDVDRRTIF